MKRTFCLLEFFIEFFSLLVSLFLTIIYYHRAKKRGCLGGRIITSRNVGQNSQILRNPLKFAVLTIFGCK